MHFRWLYFSSVSTEKTFELLVELWNDETNQEQPFDIKFGEVPLSPGIVLTMSEIMFLLFWTYQNLNTNYTTKYLQNSNFSAAIGHRFLGLCLVSVQDLISCPFQTHVVSLQGRPFSEDEGTNGTLSLQVGKHPMQY